MEQRLFKDFAMKRADEQWLAAWSLEKPKAKKKAEPPAPKAE